MLWYPGPHPPPLALSGLSSRESPPAGWEGAIKKFRTTPPPATLLPHSPAKWAIDTSTLCSAPQKCPLIASLGSPSSLLLRHSRRSVHFLEVLLWALVGHMGPHEGTCLFRKPTLLHPTHSWVLLYTDTEWPTLCTHHKDAQFSGRRAISIRQRYADIVHSHRCTMIPSVVPAPLTS